MASGQRKRYWWREKSVFPERGGTGERRMRPGQLAACDHHSGEITFREVDVRKYTAWKNGEFCFNDDTLEEILEELGRWYDVRIVYRSAGEKAHPVFGPSETV